MNLIADKHWRHKPRTVAKLAASAIVIVPAFWLRPRVAFRGHVTDRETDREGNPVFGAHIEIQGVHASTNKSGEFAVVLPKSSLSHGLRVTIRKAGYQRRL